MEYHYTIEELCQIFGGTSLHVSGLKKLNRFSIDSRTIQPGDMFFAIVGENTDGHLYIDQALQKGAQCVIAHEKKLSPGLMSSDVPLILVPDPNQALLDLARDYRNRFSKGQVLGITGSNGKTSAKELAIELCRHLFPKTHATQGNFNNFIGVPLTILSATLDEAWWVIEMGTNHFGEIETLSQLVRPHLGLITNIGKSHLEFLENTQGVAREKSGLFAGMAPGSVAAIPINLLHQEIVANAASQAQICLVTYGFDHWKSFQPPDFTAQLLSVSPSQTQFEWLGHTFEVAIGNPLQLSNLLGILTLLHLVDTPLDLLVEAVRNLSCIVQGRMQFREINSYLLVDDTYNANPTSFSNVITSLKQMYPQRRLIVVAGAMAELGEQSAHFHFELGKQMREAQVAHLFAFGDNEARRYAEGWRDGKQLSGGVYWTDEMEELVDAFHKVVQTDDLVLVKGSRSVKMERFVKALMKEPEN